MTPTGIVKLLAKGHDGVLSLKSIIYSSLY